MVIVMPYIKNDEKLANALKQFRTSHDIKAKDVADKLDKTPVYISKLENNDLAKVDLSVLIQYISFIADDNPQEIDKFFNTYLKAYDIELTKEDKEEEIKRQNFDEVIRKLTLTDNIKQFLISINMVMQEKNITVEQIVTEINNNSDIMPELIKKADLQKYNMWQLIDGEPYIIFQEKEENIKNIIECKENMFCNYVTLEVIAYSLFKLCGFPKTEAREKAYEKLQEYKIYTLAEKNIIRQQRKSYEKLEDLFAETDAENVKLINKLMQKFVNLSNLDISYANKVLSAILKNMDTDLSLTVAVMKRDLTELTTKSNNQKSEFLKEFSELINKYKMQEDEKQLTFFDNDDSDE